MIVLYTQEKTCLSMDILRISYDKTFVFGK